MRLNRSAWDSVPVLMRRVRSKISTNQRGSQESQLVCVRGRGVSSKDRGSVPGRCTHSRPSDFAEPPVYVRSHSMRAEAPDFCRCCPSKLSLHQSRAVSLKGGEEITTALGFVGCTHSMPSPIWVKASHRNCSKTGTIQPNITMPRVLARGGAPVRKQQGFKGRREIRARAEH
jgi:hypothetical protein